MTPHRDKNRGTLIIDRWFADVGRIKLASSTNKPRVLKEINDHITERHEAGDLALLRRLRQREFTPMEFLEAGRRRDWSTLSSSELTSPLIKALDAFLEDYVASTSHLANYKSAAKHLKECARADARVSDLSATLRSLKPTLRNEQRMFNVVRSFAMTFARERFGQESTLWRSIKSVSRYSVKHQRINHPASVVELRDIAAKMEKAHVGSGFMAWTLATTGMRPKEYWDEWEATGDSVRVVSAKSEQTGREERLVPLVSLSTLHTPTRPTCWIGKFRKLLSDASSGQMQPYDLRRTYANWSEDAKIPTTRFRLYFGHGARTTTDLYLWRDVRPHIAADAHALEASIEAQLATAKDVIPISEAR